MRIVVTGGAGFIGANLCRELAARSGVDRVAVLDDLSTGAAANLDGTGADLVNGSILDRDLVHEAVMGSDAIIHLAAQPSVPGSLADPLATHHVNATGTMHVLEAARVGSAHVVTASSSSVYGDAAVSPKHEDLATRPISPYGASKLAAESYTLAHGASFGLPVLALRFFNVYGPLQPAGHAYAAVIPAFIEAALDGRPLPVDGDGSQVRDFTYVGTVARVIADAVLEKVASPVPVNLAFGTRVSILELARRLAAVMGTPLEVRHDPPRPGDISDSQAASSRLAGLFPDIAPVPLDEGLACTVAWFRETRAAGSRVPDRSVATVR
jgi:UDP-glucose 4-epimerase